MDKEQIEKLYTYYSKILLNECIPFWLKNSLDHEFGGYLTCLDRKGQVFNTDKSVWFQGRGTWIYSRLYNVVEKRPEWLMAARMGYEFIQKYCCDTDGRMFFSVTRDGRPLQKRRYMFSETFAIIGLAEYSRASGDADVLKKAKDTFLMVADIYKDPSKTVPKINPDTRMTKSLSLPMILLSTAQVLRETENTTEYDEFAGELIQTIFKDFLKPGERALFETVDINGERLDSPRGRCINPGHSIETAWFLMHEGIYRKDNDIINNALKILEWSLDIGWDKEYGGILYFVDIEGKPTEQLEWDMKLWWPHTEALYALLLAYYLTNDNRYELWYKKVHEWSFNHFEDKEYGEWFGYLHRDGSVSNTLKGSMWKGPFHLPRALLLICKLLEKMKQKTEFEEI